MREIKFRAWDDKFSRMYEYGEKCIGIHYDDWELQRLFENGDEAECAEIDGEIIILMQFTGLKDKNGKEIYEGDIVKLLCGQAARRKGTVAIVEWRSPEFFMHIIKEATAHSYCGSHSCWSFERFTEIIGNIYENPELTK